MKTPLFFLLFWIVLTFPLIAQQQKARIVFYNVENLFDAEADTALQYNQFDPKGDHHWNKMRYNRKLLNLYKVLIALGTPEPPAVIGFAEIENRKVLKALIGNTPLSNFHYNIIHYNSPDSRGIDVGLIYDEKQFTPFYSHSIAVINSEDPDFRTREILYVKGMLISDTVHLFINHWPSSYSGLMKNRPKRLLAAKTLSHVTDSILRITKNANIVVMGDFNEDFNGPATQYLTNKQPFSLKKLNKVSTYATAKGTIKRGSIWHTYDRVLVSTVLLTHSGRLFVKDKSFHIFDVAFLMEKDEKYLGWKVFRTYVGYKYHGGISDHLPIYLDITMN